MRGRGSRGARAGRGPHRGFGAALCGDSVGRGLGRGSTGGDRPGEGPAVGGVCTVSRGTRAWGERPGMRGALPGLSALCGAKGVPPERAGVASSVPCVVQTGGGPGGTGALWGLWCPRGTLVSVSPAWGGNLHGDTLAPAVCRSVHCLSAGSCVYQAWLQCFEPRLVAKGGV